MARILTLLIAHFVSISIANAGLWEIGVNGNHRVANLDANNKTEATAITGSLAYYFGMMSALEGSYTYGYAKTALNFTDRPGQTVQVFYDMVGLDLVITFMGQDSPIRPYIKGGGAYIIAKDTYFQEAGSRTIKLTGVRGEDTGLVPSAGAGIKINISRLVSIKLGAEGWAATPRTPGLWDVMYRGGVSVMF